jgi:dihydroflavonol-4-reductase
VKIKVLVTGANGFLATNTILELVRNGYHVIGLLRDKKKAAIPPNENLEYMEGTLDDHALLDQLLSACTYVLHIAGETRQDLLRYADYHQGNVITTEKLLEACIRNKIKRLVYISTANTIGYGTRENPGVEEHKMRKPFTDSWYALSKLRSQETALSKCNSMEIVVVNPTFMLGPYGRKTGSDRVILMNYGKKILFYPPGGKNFIHVTDVAKGIIAAMEKGKPGETYLLCNENLSYKEFFKKLAEDSGHSPLMIRIPTWLLWLMGLFGSLLRFLGIKNEMLLTNMRILCVRNFYSNAKARQELGLEPVPVDTAIKDAISWFRQEKILR